MQTPSVILAVWNEKGGCGKTTTAIGLAGVVSRHSEVILIDLDPQTNATEWLLGSVPDGPGVLDLLAGRATLSECARPVDGRPELRVVPGSQRLVRVIAELENNPMPQLALRNALVGTGDVMVIIDCPPAYGELPVMALAAATHHVLPLKPAAMDLQGARSSLQRADAIRTQINPALVLAGFVLALFDARTSVATATEDLLAKVYPDLPVVRIPSAVVVGMAPGAHQLLEDYAPTSPATIAYQVAAERIVPTA
jgi:chromosome partitioning protein